MTKRTSALDSLDTIETLLDGAQRRHRITLTRLERLEKALEKSEEEWNGPTDDPAAE
jgi:hypothetical protein